jgi:hypothetical protein
MIIERHRDHTILQFDQKAIEDERTPTQLILKQGDEFLHDLIWEANRIGLKGRRITDIKVIPQESKTILVEVWTVPLVRSV